MSSVVRKAALGGLSLSRSLEGAGNAKRKSSRGAIHAFMIRPTAPLFDVKCVVAFFGFRGPSASLALDTVARLGNALHVGGAQRGRVETRRAQPFVLRVNLPEEILARLQLGARDRDVADQIGVTVRSGLVAGHHSNPRRRNKPQGMVLDAVEASVEADVDRTWLPLR